MIKSLHFIEINMLSCFDFDMYLPKMYNKTKRLILCELLEQEGAARPFSPQKPVKSKQAAGKPTACFSLPIDTILCFCILLDVFFLPLFHVLFQHLVDDRRDGDSQQHPPDAEQAAAHCDPQQHPKPRQADFPAHHLGVNDVPFHLLEDDEEDQEDQRLHRRDEQQQDDPNRPADIRPQHGDQGSDRNDGADEGGVIQPQETHPNKTENA